MDWGNGPRPGTSGIVVGCGKCPQTVEAKAAISTKMQKVKAAGRSFSVQTVSIPKGTPVTVGLAKKQVGQTATLPSIVKRMAHKQRLTELFEAYNGAPDPYGMLIANGKVIHIGRYGTTIGFKADGSAIMDSLQVSLTGTVTDKNGKSRSWYATFINRTPSADASISMLYTPERGANVGFKGGTAVVMEKGVVTKRYLTRMWRFLKRFCPCLYRPGKIYFRSIHRGFHCRDEL